jgi:hypothetical protein
MAFARPNSATSLKNSPLPIWVKFVKFAAFDRAVRGFAGKP